MIRKGGPCVTIVVNYQRRLESSDHLRHWWKVKRETDQEGEELEEIGFQEQERPEDLQVGQKRPEKGQTPLRLPATWTPGRSSMVDVGVQTSPIVPSQNTDWQRQNSPFFEPLSPSASRAPGPNEARKRSAARSQSTSQETAKSNVAFKDSTEDEPMQRLQTPPVLLRKRKRLSDDPNTLEIPPTPEPVQPESGSFGVMPAQLSSPKLPRSRPTHTNESLPPKSIMFMTESEDCDDGEEEYNSVRDETALTSPIMVDLVSDPIGKSSQPNQDDDLSDVETASMYNFDTAPEISLEWETAPETPRKVDARLETQALFNDSNAVDLTANGL